MEIRIGDLSFEPFITHDRIEVIIKEMATQIRTDYAAHNPICIVVLNGAFFFASDLIKAMDIQCEIHFVKLSSYVGSASTGSITKTLDAEVDVTDRDILIIEDIVDTGLTMSVYMEELRDKGARSVQLASLLVKPAAIAHDVTIQYTGLEIANDFVVGYGLDYNQKGRHLQHIYRKMST